jgi:P2-related tail formation protein
MMDLKNVSLLNLQTAFMKKDPTTQALCVALEPIFRQLADEVKSCLIFCMIDELQVDVLDELAWQMHVDWYDANADINAKRKIIKTAFKIHRYRGTPYAVEEVVKAYFSEAGVSEWFELGIFIVIYYQIHVGSQIFSSIYC